MSKEKLLTPSQMKVKKPRVVNYSNDIYKQQYGRDIITLYVACGLGYSPIRHILGLRNDKLIEDVVRQHMLGRSNVDSENGELYCPQSKKLDVYTSFIIKYMCERYGTMTDPYIKSMFETGKWKDDPVTLSKKICPYCSKEMEKDWLFCPYCNTQLKRII